MTLEDVRDRISNLFLDRQLFQIDLNDFQYHEREWHLGDTLIRLHAEQSDVERDTQYVEMLVWNMVCTMKTKEDYQGAMYMKLPMKRHFDESSWCLMFRFSYDTMGWESTHWQRDATDIDFHDLLPPPPELKYPVPRHLEIFAPPKAYSAEFRTMLNFLKKNASAELKYIGNDLGLKNVGVPNYLDSIAHMSTHSYYPPGVKGDLSQYLQMSGSAQTWVRTINVVADLYHADEVLIGRVAAFHFDQLWNKPFVAVDVDLTSPDITADERRMNELEQEFESYMRAHPEAPDNYMLVSIVLGKSDEYYRLLEEFGGL
jgi:hypothetical protein